MGKENEDEVLCSKIFRIVFGNRSSLSVGRYCTEATTTSFKRIVYKDVCLF